MGACEAIIKTLANTREVNKGNVNEKLRWDVRQVTDEILNQLSVGLDAGIDSIIKSETARKKIKYKADLASKSLFNGKNNAMQQRVLNIGFTLLIDTIKANYDVSQNRDVDLNSNVIDESTGLMNVSYNHFCQLLARQVWNSQGLRSVKGSTDEIAMNEFNAGQMMVKELIDSGVVKVVESGSYIYNGQMEDGKRRANDYTIKSLSGKVIQLNPQAFGDVTNSDIVKRIHNQNSSVLYKEDSARYDKFNSTLHTARAISRLTKATREVLPNTESKATDPNLSKAHGVTLTEKNKETLDMLAQGARQINPLFANIFNELSQLIPENGSALDILKDEKGLDPEFLNEVLGVDRPIIISNEFRQSDDGIARTKSNNLVNFLDNFKMFIDEKGKSLPLFFNYFMFRTGRSLADQNILNATTDKHLARAILASEPVEIGIHSEAFGKVKGCLVEDYKVDPQLINNMFILGKNYANVEAVLNSPDMEMYIKLFKDPESDMYNLSAIRKLAILFHQEDGLIKKYNSIYDKIKGLDMLYEVATGMKSGTGKVTISHDVAPDASGSGLLINLLQSLGLGGAHLNDVKGIITKLGLLPDENGNFNATIDSLYTLVGNQLKTDLMLNVKTQLNSKQVHTAQPDFKLLELFAQVNTRELAKIPVMTMGAYNQNEKNAVKSIANELTWMLYQSFRTLDTNELTDSNSVKFLALKESLLANPDLNPSIRTQLEKGNINNISSFVKADGTMKAMVAHFSRDAGISKALVSTTKRLVKDKLSIDMQKDIDTLYSAIENHIKSTGMDPAKVKIISPQAMIDNGMTMEYLKNLDTHALASLLNHWGLPLTKRGESINKDGLTVMVEALNKPSFAVSTTHMIDGAIEHIALHKSLKEYYEKYGKYPGVSPIHDANNSDPLFAEIMDRNYTQAILEVNTKYNKIQMLVLTAKALGVDASTYSSIQGTLDKSLSEGVNTINTITENLNQSTKESNAKLYGYKQTTTQVSARFNELISLQDYNNLSPEYRTMYNELHTFFMENPTILTDTNSTFDYQVNNQGNESITANKNVSTESKLKYLYHEVIHANTAQYIDDHLDSTEVKYLYKVIDKLFHESKLDSVISKLFSNDQTTHEDAMGNKLTKQQFVQERFNYILGQNNSIQAMKELVAILGAEPEMKVAFDDVIRELYPTMNPTDDNGNSRIATFIKSIVNAIKNMLGKSNSISKSLDILTKKFGISADITHAIVQSTIDNGKSHRSFIKMESELAPQELGAMNVNPDTREIAMDYKEYLGTNTLKDPFSSATALANQYARQILTLSLESYGKKLYDDTLAKNHVKFMRTSPIYKAIVETLQDARQNEHVQQIVNYINLDNFKDRNARSILLAKIRMAEQERNKLDNTYTRNLSDKIEAKFNETEIDAMYYAYTKSAIFNLTNSSTILLDLLSNDPSKIDDMTNVQNYINNYVKANGLTALEEGTAKDLAYMYVNDKVQGYVTTDNIRAYALDKTKASHIETVAALYALKESNGIDTIRNVHTKAPEIHTELITVATGIKFMLNKLESSIGSTESPMMANIVADIAKENSTIITVDLMEFNKGTYNEDWKVLRKPEVGKLGILYRTSLDKTQPGLATSNNVSVDGLILDKANTAKYTDLHKNNAVTTYAGADKVTKIIFSKKEKEDLGIVKNPAHGLYRTYAHLQFLNDTQPIREALASKAFNKAINDKVKDGNDLKADILNPDKEHSWFLNVNGSIAFNELPKEVQERYKPVKGLTKLGKFGSQITHVRKDISYWLVGYKEPELLANNYKLNRALDIYKKLFALTKIHWVITNPAKIAKDAISNFTYLVSRNVSIAKIAKYTPEILKGIGELNQYRNQLVAAKLQLAGNETDTALQTTVKNLQNTIDTHKYAFILKNGYNSALSTDMVLKDTNTMTGLENDINNVLNKLVRDNKGDLNTIGKFISKFAKSGISTEDLMKVVVHKLDSNNSTKTVASILDGTANELARLREKEDVAKYLSQFIASPGSEIVKLSSAAIMTIEVVSKALLHMDLKEKGKSEQETIQDVQDSFLDYTVNLPMALKIPSDFGVLMFPTFWARIQKVIYMLGRDNPISLATAFTTAELLDLQGSNIVGSNIFSKLGDGSILNSPELTLQALIPTNAFGIPFVDLKDLI